MKNLAKSIKQALRFQEVYLGSFLLAMAVLKTPLQHYITLSRFQHYGICIFICALGFILQTVISWRQLSSKGRACLLTSGIYLATFADMCYQNPWLDSRMSVQTEDQELLRLIYCCLLGTFGVIVTLTWIAWLSEQRIQRSNEEIRG